MFDTHNTHSIFVSIAMNPDCVSEVRGSIGMSVYNAIGMLIDEVRIIVSEVDNSAELELCGLVEALSYAQDGDGIYVTSAFCERGYNEWLDNWKAKGWRKADKKPVAYRQLWQQVDNLRAEKYVEVHFERLSNMEPQILKANALAKSCFDDEDLF